MPDYKLLKDMAYARLRDMIYNSEFEFDRIYSETKLAADLSISRTPMRDALNRLAYDRYIDVLPNRGFRLHSPTQADILEAYHVRMMFEGYCAEMVAKRYPEDAARAVIARMEAALGRQRAMLADGGYGMGPFWLEDLAFHKALLEYMHIPSVCTQYEAFMHIFMPQNLASDLEPVQRQSRALDRHRSTLVEHAEIIEALKSRDLNRVHTAVRGHVDSSLRALYVSPEE